MAHSEPGVPKAETPATTLLGVLYGLSIVAVVLASALLQAASLPIFAWLAVRDSQAASGR